MREREHVPKSFCFQPHVYDMVGTRRRCVDVPSANNIEAKIIFGGLWRLAIRRASVPKPPGRYAAGILAYQQCRRHKSPLPPARFYCQCATNQQSRRQRWP